MRRTLLAVALLTGACAAGSAPARRSTEDGSAVVVKVVDGDTLRVRIGGAEERVRLIGIDTPETHGAGGLRECFGKEATARMKQLAPPGTSLRLERDEDQRDRYGRLLAYVYRARDNMFINMVMAREGYADVLAIAPNETHSDAFSDAVADAREASRGLWHRCGSADVPI